MLGATVNNAALSILGEYDLSTCAAVIVASGRGSRFGGDLPKQYQPLCGKPLLSHALQAFARHPGIGPVRVVIHPDDGALYDKAVEGLDILAPVFGGTTRQESVRLGLDSLEPHQPAKVLIHDGARPLIQADLIDRVIEALATRSGAIPALPVADTLKRADKGVIGATISRQGLFRAQTPQGFDYQAIVNAHHEMSGQTLTDDAAVAEACGINVAVVGGDESNLKVTENSDMARAAQHLTNRYRPRTGMGFDVHRLAPGDGLVLMGLTLPEPFAMLGHSDADVGLHALTDALLGALADGDIGSHFPPSDPQWKGADSTVFLTHARDLITQAGGLIEHVDVTLICERPKIGSYRPAMVERVATLLDLPANRVSVKATTTERLGFTGRGEGIAAQAVATVLFS